MQLAICGLVNDQLIETWDGIPGDLDFLAEQVADAQRPLEAGPAWLLVHQGLHHAQAGEVPDAVRLWQRADAELAALTHYRIADRYPDLMVAPGAELA